MKDLFFSECRRFRNTALIFAAVNMLVQLYFSRMTDLLHVRREPQMLMLAIFALAGLAFGIYQFGSYRQPSRWVWLLHRPLAPRTIFLSLAMAAAALILFAIGLPALLTVAGADLAGRTVDVRHYLLVVHLVALTLCAWLSGAYVALQRSRTAIVVLLLPVLMLLHLASAWVMLAPTFVCLALLAAIAAGAFKPDRLAPPSGAAAQALAAIPLLLGFYFVMSWGGSLMFQNVQILAGVHPLNVSVPPAGGYTEVARAEGPDLMLAGLAHSTDPRAEQWKRQARLLKVSNFEAGGDQFPVRHQASNLDQLQWHDEKRRIIWTFSHDSMLFEGHDAYTAGPRGTLGLGGIGDTRPFPAVPVLPQAGYILLPQQLYEFDGVTGAIRQVIALRAPESLAGMPKEIGNRLYVVTNQRVIAYEKPEDYRGPLREAFSLALPGPFSDFARVDVADLLDSTLVSISFGRAMVDGATGSTQTIMLVDSNGKGTVVAKRALAHDFPALFEHHAWWISPALHAVQALPEVLLDRGYIRDAGAGASPPWYPRPLAAWIAAVLASLMSGAGAWYWLRGSKASSRRKASWIAACLLLGAPALPAMMLLQARTPKPQESKAVQAQAVPA